MYARIAALAAGLLLAISAPLHANDTTFVKLGARVRLEAPQSSDSRLVGEVSGLPSDALVILPEDGGSVLTIPWSEIEEIEVYEGRRSNWLLGGAVGFVVFGAAGAVIGAEVLYQLDPGAPSQSEAAAIAGAIGAVAGFGIGAGIGSLFKTERWTEAQLPELPPVALGIGKDGSVRLAFSLRLH